MSISSVNCTPIKPQVSFGSENIGDAQRVLDLSKGLSDKYESKDPQKKNVIQTALSVAGVIATTYLLGKVAANKAMELFPSLSGRIGSGLDKAGTALKGQAKKLMANNKNKFATMVGDKTIKFEAAARDKLTQAVSKNGAESLIKKAAGVGAIAGIAPKILTVDGNNDGYADIAQKGINAYKNALQDVSSITEIVSALG